MWPSIGFIKNYMELNLDDKFKKFNFIKKLSENEYDFE